MDRWFLTISRGSEKPKFFFWGEKALYRRFVFSSRDSLALSSEGFVWPNAVISKEMGFRQHCQCFQCSKLKGFHLASSQSLAYGSASQHHKCAPAVVIRETNARLSVGMRSSRTSGCVTRATRKLPSAEKTEMASFCF
jgi:hypothetical protein